MPRRSAPHCGRCCGNCSNDGAFRPQTFVTPPSRSTAGRDRMRMFLYNPQWLPRTQTLWSNPTAVVIKCVPSTKTAGGGNGHQDAYLLRRPAPVDHGAVPGLTAGFRSSAFSRQAKQQTSESADRFFRLTQWICIMTARFPNGGHHAPHDKFRQSRPGRLHAAAWK